MNFDHALDRPVWNCLNGRQGDLAVARGEAVRIDSRYGPFAAARDKEEASQRALANLLRDANDEIWVVETEAWTPPAGTIVRRQAELLQMIAEEPQPRRATDRAPEALGEAHLSQMTALAQATEPGPWGEWTHKYGQFFGFLEAGRLKAMAGERMRPAVGLAEVSGVCTWPQYQGQGLAGQLIRKVMADMVARGDAPFLHSYAGNEKAIGLYESLGFRPRRKMVVTILAKG